MKYCDPEIVCMNVMQYDLMNPIMLSKNSNLTHLFFLEFQEKCMHPGVNTMFNILKVSRFWTPKDRAVIKTVLSKCFFICKKVYAYAFEYSKRPILFLTAGTS